MFCMPVSAQGMIELQSAGGRVRRDSTIAEYGASCNKDALWPAAERGTCPRRPLGLRELLFIFDRPI